LVPQYGTNRAPEPRRRPQAARGLFGGEQRLRHNAPRLHLHRRESRAMNRLAREEIDMKARIRITLKTGVLDPQGKAIQSALGGLGIAGVNDVRQGKYIEVELTEADEASAKAKVERMCRELLANLVIENYAYELVA
jgi:phosphoribosylformylglycinamidine synthase